MNIFDTTGHQVAIQIPSSPNVCFCITWGNDIVIFCKMSYRYRIEIEILISSHHYCLHCPAYSYSMHACQLSRFAETVITCPTLSMPFLQKLSN